MILLTFVSLMPSLTDPYCIPKLASKFCSAKSSVKTKGLLRSSAKAATLRSASDSPNSPNASDSRLTLANADLEGSITITLPPEIASSRLNLELLSLTSLKTKGVV